MPQIFDAESYRRLIHEALEALEGNEELTMYYQWALAHKRCWSDSMADWCQTQPNLTHPKITQRWRTHGADHRRRDLEAMIRRASEKVRAETVDRQPSQTDDLPI